MREFWGFERYRKWAGDIHTEAPRFTSLVFLSRAHHGDGRDPFPDLVPTRNGRYTVDADA